MLKLGADHLPPGFDGPVDRRVAAAPHVPLIRLRMQQIARLLAEALVAPLADAPAAPLHLVNIAGGPALDSINALIILARVHATLIHRPIAIHVFDAREDGPTLGARASCALHAGRAATGARGPIPAAPLRLERHRAARAPGRRPRRAWRDHRGLVGGRPVRIRHRRRDHRQPHRARAGRRAGHELERGAQADDCADEIPTLCARLRRLRTTRRTERVYDRRKPYRSHERAGAAAAAGHADLWAAGVTAANQRGRWGVSARHGEVF
jgi:hypothetical protein